MKPTVCATFPIGRCIKWERTKAPSEDPEQTTIQFIHNKADCGGEKETHTVREWLEAFDIPVDDDFFIKWNRQIFMIGEVVKRAEKKLDGELLNRMCTTIYFMLYLDYDTGKDFMAQFEENAVREDSSAELIADGKTIMISNRAYDITQYDVFKMNSGVRIDDSKIKGHGIGMELCREIVKSHGWNMKYYFDEGVIQVTIVVN